MNSIINTKYFYGKFKSQSFALREELINELSDVFDLPEFHFSKFALNRYFRKYPNVYLDKNIAKKVLASFFDSGSFFITNFDAQYNGGYIRNKVTSRPANPDELIIDAELLKKVNDNWSDFVKTIQNRYWEDNKNYSRYLKLESSNSFYENRNPNSLREKILSKGIKFETEGKVGQVEKYNFFNSIEVINYYNKLIQEFFSDFVLFPKVSNKKIKRYGKRISDKIVLGLYVDFSILERELKNGYLELPKFHVELFSTELKKFISEHNYLKEQQEFLIGRVDLFYFMGDVMDNRIGNSSYDEELLKRKLFFNLDVYSFYLKKYLNKIEKVIGNIDFNSL